MSTIIFNQQGSTTARRHGFTLLEMLVVMWSLGLAMLMGVLLIITVMKADRVGTRTQRSIIWREELAERFRADVRAARTAPAQVNDFQAGPSCLLLQAPGGTTIMYRWEDGRLERIEQTKTTLFPRLMHLGSDTTTIEFLRAGRDRELLTLRLTESPKYGPVRQTDLAAALGGNQR